MSSIVSLPEGIGVVPDNSALHAACVIINSVHWRLIHCAMAIANMSQTNRMAVSWQAK
jgi:hypothetical protein